MTSIHGSPVRTALYDLEINRLDGSPADLGAYRGQVILAVNTASRCGFTPQYAGLQRLWDAYRDQGLVVLGFPCNQFFRQEPGDAARIQEFCSVNYGVTFPLFERVDVKGGRQHPLFAMLSEVADDKGKAGAVAWNFEKFLVDRDGNPVRRFRSKTTPEDPALVAAIEQLLDAPAAR